MSASVDEFARQRALDTYRVVDSLPDDAYDDIVQLASALCEAPIALISLIDRDRQWFKARTGLDIEQSRRDIAFCDHVIREPDRLMEVPDAAADSRFVDNPFVTEDDIRFYAGMPLVTPGGAPIGTVCVLDKEPRQLSETQKRGLAALARLTMNLLEARHRERELERAAMLAQAAESEAGAPEHEAPAGDGFSIALFEVQDLAGTSRRIGDRALKRALEQLEHALEAALRPGSGDSVSHAAGSGELIVVLHGDDCSEPFQRLQDLLPGFEAETSLRVLCAAAEAETPKQRLEEVFLRADEALSRLKDELCEAAAVQ
jgi:GAF domain-containing protein